MEVRNAEWRKQKKKRTHEAAIAAVASLAKLNRAMAK